MRRRLSYVSWSKSTLLATFSRILPLDHFCSTQMRYIVGWSGSMGEPSIESAGQLLNDAA